MIALPRWAQAVAGAALLITAFLIWDWLDDRAAIKAHEGAVAGQVAKQADAAATSAADAVNATQTEVGKTNEQARRDAAVSNDPLAAGFDRLRAEKR